MKNDLVRYTVKKGTVPNMIVTAVVSAVIALAVIIIAAIFGDVDKDDNTIHNITTAFVMFWGFISSFAVCTASFNSSICFNRSRKSAIKAAFISLLISTVVCSAVNLGIEAVVAGFSKTFDFNYSFTPLIKAFGVLKVNNDVGGLLLAYGFHMLLYYLVSVTGMLIMCACMKFGKWAWIGFWGVYMLVFLLGKSVVKGFKEFTVNAFGSVGMTVLCLAIVLSALFTVLTILLMRKTELNKKTLLFGNGYRRA